VAPVALIYALNYVRSEADAKAKPLAESVALPELLIALFWGIVPLLALAYFYENAWLLALAVIPVGAVTWIAGAWFKRRIGGYTGDCLGATQQIAEVVFYLHAVALLAGPVPQ
jgi:adenosylcobinamide-GDP ribazoletransferase